MNFKYKAGDIVKVISEGSTEDKHGVRIGSMFQISMVHEDGNEGSPYESGFYSTSFAEEDTETWEEKYETYVCNSCGTRYIGE